MLDARKKRVLQAIIEEYIETAEPVSSSSIIDNNNLNYSSATIRNEMAELEKEGYLEKPHTSAGRVPSAKGYRFYVDELLSDDNINIDEIQYIKSKLETKVNEIKELTKITTNTISELTNYATVAIGPKSTEQTIEDIKFVLLGSRVLMAVILTDAGVIKESIIKFDEDITNSQVQNLNFIFNKKLRGKAFAKIDKPMEEYIESEMNNQISVIEPIIIQMNKAISESEELYLEGTSKIFDFPEFRKVDAVKNLMSLLDQKDTVVDLLNTGFAQDINVYIGGESANDELKDISIITFKHTVGNKNLGTIGIIGPQRMDYSKVISVMKYISQRLNKSPDDD
ncbi:MAG: heat-inducible transcriptional repressor HrcA [Lachnospiraceae bacterium]|jgi:heat-inducible transcriptional repressor|nr:heat-inducible transcriptional repressor HrcA [Lachnospiraceae bacterium]